MSWEGLHYKKDMRTHQKSCFEGVAWNFLSPKSKEVPIITQNNLSPVMFLAQYPTSYHKNFHCGPFEAKHPNRC